MVFTHSQQYFHDDFFKFIGIIYFRLYRNNPAMKVQFNIEL